jgi:hypothetical protein
VTVLDGPQYAVTSSHPWAIHSSRVELIFSVSTHVHLCWCPYAMSPDARRRFLTERNQLHRGWSPPPRVANSSRKSAGSSSSQPCSPPRLGQDVAELDHVRVVEVVQVHPHHRYRNVRHRHEEISNSHQDVILGGGGPLSANVAVDERTVVGRGLQTMKCSSDSRLRKTDWQNATGAPVDWLWIRAIPAAICDFCSEVIWPSWP